MQLSGFRFDRTEFAGSLGDLGTLLPLSLALITLNGLSVTPVFLMVGVFYSAAGLYFRLPIPVQPLKVVSAVAIAAPLEFTPPIIAASGIVFGVTLLVLSFGGLIDRLARFFSKPVVRGIQLGLGFVLMKKGIQFMVETRISPAPEAAQVYLFDAPAEIPLNLAIGVGGFLLALFLLTNRRCPAALVLVAGGVIAALFFWPFTEGAGLGPTAVALHTPTANDFLTATTLLVIPQLPLTLGNAVMGTADACYTFFGKQEAVKRSTYKAFAGSMGFVNVIAGFLGAMPLCHGAGGLAAHYRFGARTGGANLMIGGVFIGVALIFGKIGFSLLSAIPYGVLGVLLVFAGIELALMVRDVTERSDLFVTMLIAGIGFATTNMAIAFGSGIVVWWLISKWKIEV